jgi:hypothetical protein
MKLSPQQNAALRAMKSGNGVLYEHWGPAGSSYFTLSLDGEPVQVPGGRWPDDGKSRLGRYTVGSLREKGLVKQSKRKCKPDELPWIYTLTPLGREVADRL